MEPLRFAVVPHSGGEITNVIVGESLEIVEAIVGECVQETPERGTAIIGGYWDGEVFLPERPVPPDPPTGESPA